MSAPPLTLIVIATGPRPRLPETLASIWEQRWVEPEVIVVDRGLGEEARTWLETQRARVSAVVRSSAAEPEGVGCNAALQAARGDWVLLLTAGDRLVGDMVLSESLNWLKRTEAGVAAGEVASDTGTIGRLRSAVNPLARDFLPRSGTFYRRSLFAENGDLEISLATMARYELHLRLWKNRVRFKPITLRIAATEADPAFDRRACREEIRVRHLYFAAWRCLWWDLRSVLRWVGGAAGRALWN